MFVFGEALKKFLPRIHIADEILTKALSLFGANIQNRSDAWFGTGVWLRPCKTVQAIAAAHNESALPNLRDSEVMRRENLIADRITSQPQAAVAEDCSRPDAAAIVLRESGAGCCPKDERGALLWRGDWRNSELLAGPSRQVRPYQHPDRMPSARLSSWADLVHAARQEGAVVFHHLLGAASPSWTLIEPCLAPEPAFRRILEDILELRLAA